MYQIRFIYGISNQNHSNILLLKILKRRKHRLLLHREDQEVSDNPPSGMASPYQVKTMGSSSTCINFLASHKVSFLHGGYSNSPIPLIGPCKLQSHSAPKPFSPPRTQRNSETQAATTQKGPRADL